MTPCLYLIWYILILTAAVLHSFYSIISPVDPFPGFLVLTSHLRHLFTGRKPSQVVESKELLRLAAMPSLPASHHPTPQHQWEPTSSFPVQHIGVPVVCREESIHGCRQPRCDTVKLNVGQKCSPKILFTWLFCHVKGILWVRLSIGHQLS